jgi:hypothetical protein
MVTTVGDLAGFSAPPEENAVFAADVPAEIPFEQPKWPLAQYLTGKAGAASGGAGLMPRDVEDTPPSSSSSSSDSEPRVPPRMANQRMMRILDFGKEQRRERTKYPEEPLNIMMNEDVPPYVVRDARSEGLRQRTRGRVSVIAAMYNHFFSTGSSSDVDYTEVQPGENLPSEDLEGYPWRRMRNADWQTQRPAIEAEAVRARVYERYRLGQKRKKGRAWEKVDGILSVLYEAKIPAVKRLRRPRPESMEEREGGDGSDGSPFDWRAYVKKHMAFPTDEPAHGPDGSDARETEEAAGESDADADPGSADASSEGIVRRENGSVCPEWQAHCALVMARAEEQDREAALGKAPAAAVSYVEMARQRLALEAKERGSVGCNACFFFHPARRCSLHSSYKEG